jgi:hypothetical protein
VRIPTPRVLFFAKLEATTEVQLGDAAGQPAVLPENGDEQIERERLDSERDGAGGKEFTEEVVGVDVRGLGGGHDVAPA